MSLCRQRAEFRMNLIRKIKGLVRYDESYAEEQAVLNNDSVCGQTVAISSDIDDITDIWLTEEDKNLLRYYYYILHEIDDTHAGTLDSDTLKKITSMVSAEWQKRHDECSNRLIQEFKLDYVTSMKKSIVDFVLQEPFEEILCAPVSMTFTMSTWDEILFHAQIFGMLNIGSAFDNMPFC